MIGKKNFSGFLNYYNRKYVWKVDMWVQEPEIPIG